MLTTRKRGSGTHAQAPTLLVKCVAMRCYQGPVARDRPQRLWSRALSPYSGRVSVSAVGGRGLRVDGATRLLREASGACRREAAPVGVVRIGASVYLGGVAASSGKRVVVRWVLMVSLLTVASVGLAAALAASAGRSFGSIEAFLVVEVSIAVWAVPVAWFVGSRYPIQPGVGLRDLFLRRVSLVYLDDNDAPVRPEQRERYPVADSIAPVPDRAPLIHTHLPVPRFEHRSTAVARVPSDVDVALSAPNGVNSVTGRPLRPPQTVELPSPALRVSSPPPPDDQPGETPTDDRGAVAKRLTEVLNLYESVGLASADSVESSTSAPDLADHDPAERALWEELVEEYGAVSIDFRSSEAGGCHITVSTGDVVFYSADRDSWMWIIFETPDHAPATRHGIAPARTPQVKTDVTDRPQ